MEERTVLTPFIVKKNLEVGKGLSIENKALIALHRVVDVKVAHSDNVFVDIELPKVPA